MAKTVIVKLTDDLDGGDADETVYFALDGKSYEIDVSAANAAKLREALKPFIVKGRVRSGQAAPRATRPQGPAPAATLYSTVEGRREGSLPGLGEHGDRPPDQRRPGAELGRRRKAVGESRENVAPATGGRADRQDI